MRFFFFFRFDRSVQVIGLVELIIIFLLISCLLSVERASPRKYTSFFPYNSFYATLLLHHLFAYVMRRRFFLTRRLTLLQHVWMRM